MKNIFLILFMMAFPTILICQSAVTFDYFRRSGKVDVRYYVKNENGKQPLHGVSNFKLPNSSEEQFFIIEFSNLTLGMDKNKRGVKQKKDAEDYILYIPQDPLSMTVSGENLHLSNVTNNGFLSDESTDKANKSVSVFYQFFNHSNSIVNADFQIKFIIDAAEGAKPLKPEHKGGKVIKCTLNIEPNKSYHQQVELASEENNMYQIFVNESKIAYKINHARNYLNKFNTVNEQRANELKHYLSSVSDFINPKDYDKIIFSKIAQFCAKEKEVERCSNICTQYQDLVWDEPDNYTGQYLEKSFFYRIKLLSENPTNQWLTYCEKFLYKFPQSPHHYAVSQLAANYKSEIEAEKKVYITKQNNFSYSNTQTTSISDEFVNVTESNEEEDEFIPLLPEKKDYAIILINENNDEITIQTEGVSSEGYVVEFKDQSDQHIEHDPSFIGKKVLYKLDDIKKKQFRSGKYKISVFSKMDKKIMASTTITYRSTKIPPKVSYILTISCFVLGFYGYKRYIKL